MGWKGFWIRPSFKDPFLSRRLANIALANIAIHNFFIAVRWLDRRVALARQVLDLLDEVDVRVNGSEQLAEAGQPAVRERRATC
jgi:hypothetical protein